MNLFELNANTGMPDFDPIVFEIKEFRKIVSKDKTKNKTKAKTEIAFVWFYADYKSDFSNEIDEDKKIREIIEILDLPKNWTKDKDVDAAINRYKELTKTPSTILLEQTKKTITKLSIFLENIDFDKLDKNGKPIYDMKKVVETTTQIPKLIATLREIEERVREEQENIEKEIRGNKNLEVYEDGIPFD